jgi:4-hydroxy-tetrahydrodipicolinate synthase
MTEMKKIQGIIPPMVTPLLDGKTLDEQGSKRIINRMIDAGVAGIFVLGTTGESQSLSMRLRFDFVSLAARYIAGRVPLLVGITETSLEDSLALAAHAKKEGAVAVVAAAPYYFPANQQELIDWYTALADASPLPVFLYNMPSKVKVFLQVPTVVALSKHPNIIGVKDSSGNQSYFQSLLYHFAGTDFAVYMGPEEQMIAAVLCGGDGGVSGGANLFPELFVKAYQAAASGNIEETRRLQKRIMHLSDSLYGLEPGSDASFVKAIKCSLEIKGIASGYLPLPYTAFKGEQVEKVKRILDTLKDYR